jgi:hypothetical protein
MAPAGPPPLSLCIMLTQDSKGITIRKAISVKDKNFLKANTEEISFNLFKIVSSVYKYLKDILTD